MNLVDKWAHLGHCLGECWYSDTVGYVNIPKNASSTVKGYLIPLGWTPSTTMIECEKYFTILRDPIDRWVSGMAQFAVGHLNNFTIPIEEIFETVTFDDHTEKQTYFLQPFNLDNITFIECDQNLRPKIEKFLVANGFQAAPTVIFDNINESKSKQFELAQKIKKILYQNPHYQIKLKNFFSEDYELIKSVKFYK